MYTNRHFSNFCVIQSWPIRSTGGIEKKALSMPILFGYVYLDFKCSKSELSGSI